MKHGILYGLKTLLDASFTVIGSTIMKLCLVLSCSILTFICALEIKVEFNIHRCIVLLTLNL